jgi:integrase
MLGVFSGVSKSTRGYIPVARYPPVARDLLADTKIRQAQPRQKAYRLHDGAGLYLHVQTNGSKYWRLKFRYHGKERVLALGVYPDVGLATARAEAMKARGLIREGKDPVAERKRARGSSAETFQAVAEEWIESQSNVWSPSYKESVQSALAANLYPKIGSTPIRAITVPVMRDALLVMEKREVLAALRKVRMWASGVFRYAIATGRAEVNPAETLRGTFKAHKPRNFAAITDRDQLAELIVKIRTYDGSIITRLALSLMILTFTRTKELRWARWSEFDLENARWTIPGERMKMREEHIVPLSRHALSIIEELKTLRSSEFLFPSETNPRKPMSENTMLYALYRLGYHSRSTVHGFRSSASSLLNKMGFNPDWIERRLSHRERNKVRAAYHREEYLEERRGMMQKWADFIDALALAAQRRAA